MNLKAIGRRIKAAREQKGLTQEALAEQVDLSPMHISVIERGFKPTKLDTFCNIANVLDVSADTLLQDVINRSADPSPLISIPFYKTYRQTNAERFITAFKPILMPTKKTVDSPASKRLPAGFLFTPFD